MGLCTTACIRVLQIMMDNGIENKSLCMIGRQNIGIEWNTFMRIIDKMDIFYDKEIYTKINNIYPIDTYQFFKMFGLKDVHAIDLNPKDGADIIFNLNDTISDDMVQKYDFILNGGTSEHIFDAAKTMANISDMVKVGGVIIHLVPLAGYIDHGFYSFSPTFFIDYYYTNRFDVKSINMAFYLDKTVESEWQVIYSQDCRLFNNWESINAYIKMMNLISDIGRCMIWCVAKRKEKVDITYPIQAIYSGIYEEKELCRKNLKTDKKVIYISKVIKFLEKNIDKSIALFCAGKICGQIINELIKKDMEDYIQVIFDNDISKSGNLYRGYKIVYPTKKKLNEITLILICTDRYEDEIYDSLLNKGIEKQKLYKITELT